MRMASSAQQCFTVLTDEDGVPGSKFEREPEEYTVEQLRRWLKCRGLKLNGKRDDLLKRLKTVPQWFPRLTSIALPLARLPARLFVSGPFS